MTDMTPREKVIYEALRFAVWAAGEGLSPAEGEPAAAPEDFLFAYSSSTGDEDWDDMPAALSRPAPTQDWQPMETAPKDGREVLVGFHGQFRWISFVALALGIDTSTPGYARPTHWRPLPPPPSSLASAIHHED